MRLRHSVGFWVVRYQKDIRHRGVALTGKNDYAVMILSLNYGLPVLLNNIVVTSLRQITESTAAFMNDLGRSDVVD